MKTVYRYASNGQTPAHVDEQGRKLHNFNSWGVSYWVKKDQILQQLNAAYKDGKTVTDLYNVEAAQILEGDEPSKHTFGYDFYINDQVDNVTTVIEFDKLCDGNGDGIPLEQRPDYAEKAERIKQAIVAVEAFEFS